MIVINEEMVDTLIYGKCQKTRVEQLYAEHFSDRHHPTHSTFIKHYVWKLSPLKWVQNKRVINDGAEVVVLATVAINPHASSCKMEREI